MENKENKEGIWFNLSLSPKFIGIEMDSFLDKIKKLKEAANDLDSSGRLLVFMSSVKDKFSPIDKLASNLILIRKIYNERNFMRDPAIATEFAEIAGHINSINKIIEKRKSKKRGKNNEKINEKINK